MRRYHVFGRVKPEQKKQFVIALQEQGHVVAMTGDGVNDTLALKQADCSVAMAAGSDAARNVAQLVLVDNDFASMPKVVAEGRRSINNLQRSASLFLVKTLLSMSLAVLFVLLPWQYPFQPIQMTLISAFTIGIPSFVLALEPNRDRIRGRFLENVIVKSIPGAVCAVLGVLAVNAVGRLALGLGYGQVSTLCVLLVAWVGVMLIVRLSGAVHAHPQRTSGRGGGRHGARRDAVPRAVRHRAVHRSHGRAVRRLRRCRRGAVPLAVRRARPLARGPAGPRGVNGAPFPCGVAV